MWESRRLTILCSSTACFRDDFLLKVILNGIFWSWNSRFPVFRFSVFRTYVYFMEGVLVTRAPVAMCENYLPHRKPVIFKFMYLTSPPVVLSSNLTPFAGRKNKSLLQDVSSYNCVHFSIILIINISNYLPDPTSHSGDRLLSSVGRILPNVKRCTFLFKDKIKAGSHSERYQRAIWKIMIITGDMVNLRYRKLLSNRSRSSVALPQFIFFFFVYFFRNRK
jgi:hypothetical protein